MHIDLVFSALPPALDGIGDYTARLAETLAVNHDVRVLTARTNAAPIKDAEVVQAFDNNKRKDIRSLAHSVAAHPPDWLVVQFNQFSYGRWGLNPYLPWTLRSIQGTHPEVNVAVMFHEDFVPVTNWKNAIMTTWQRAQFWALGHLADVAFFSIQPWADRYQSWWPNTPVHHLPVGSNMPFVDLSQAAAREAIGLDPETFILGMFGSLHASRMIEPVRRAVRTVQQETDDFLVLYVGPDGPTLRQTLPGVPLHDAGRLPAREVSVHLTAMDAHLAPFSDGVSTRRGSFLAGLQQGIATVSTRGPLTDPILSEHDGDAILLAPVDDASEFAKYTLMLYRHPNRRRKIEKQARALHQRYFTWDAIAQQMVKVLKGEVASRSAPSPSAATTEPA